MALRALSVCAGIGGLDLGIRLACEVRTVCYVEREGAAAAKLVDRMGQEALDRAPVWDDLETFDGAPWRGRVDLVTGGFPCQPFSSAGSRGGGLDERWLWDHVARVLDETGAPLLFVENVPGLFTARGARCAWCGARLRDVHSLGLVCSGCGDTALGCPADPLRALAEILGSLAALGFDAVWDVFSAAGVGAPHLRRRMFLLAWRVSDALRDAVRFQPERGQGPPRPPEPRDPVARDVGEGVGLADPDRCREDRFQLWPPGPSGDWRGTPTEAQPSICGVADGFPARLDEREALRGLGNAVVPLVAAHAFRTLAARIPRA